MELHSTGRASQVRPLAMTLLGGAVSATWGFGLPDEAYAGTLTLPSDLSPGAHFRLMFTTSNKIANALSSDIATYNTFVATDAKLNSALDGMTFLAIGSTATVNAIDNIACTPSCAADPIYLVNGTRVADNTAALFGGQPLLVTTILTESGTVPAFTGSFSGPYTWTGSQPNGTVATDHGLGSDSPVYGFANAGGGTGWLESGTTGAGWCGTSPVEYCYYVYGVSTELTMPETTVPEPATFGLLVTGLAGLGALRRAGDRAKA